MLLTRIKQDARTKQKIAYKQRTRHFKHNPSTLQWVALSERVSVRKEVKSEPEDVSLNNPADAIHDENTMAF